MTTQGLMGKGVPAGLPPFLLYMKIAIMVLSLIILALAAYTIAIWNQWTSGIGYGYYVYSGVGGLLIFVVIKTWLIYGIFLALEFKAPHMFYRIAAIIGYVLSVIFWLSAWAWAASNASVWLGAYSGYYDYNLDGTTVNNPFKGYGAALAACAGLGAVVWILSIVHLVFFARACMNDNSNVTHSQAELGQMHQKHEATTNVYAAPAPAPVYAAPAGYQQAYPQQQYAQQQAYPAQ